MAIRPSPTSTPRLPTVPAPTLMPNSGRPLPIRCPKCEHDGSLLVVKSLTVMTLTCAACAHVWATEMAQLPPNIQARVPDALAERRQTPR
jgi:transcription elongation factor Elf1